PPTTILSPSAPANGAGWINVSPLLAELVGRDNPAGAGLSRTYFALDDSSCTPPTTGVTLPASCQTGSNLVVSSEGRHTLYFFSAATAGNFEAQQQAAVNIDPTPPTLTFGTPSPAPNASGWNNTNVTVPCLPADALSGVATVSPTCPLTLSTE